LRLQYQAWTEIRIIYEPWILPATRPTATSLTFGRRAPWQGGEAGL
jgi:hypothetical protein